MPQQSFRPAFILIVLSFAAVGCGKNARQPPPSISAADVASSAEHEVLAKRHLHVKATCVPGALQEKHKTFNCTVRLRDGKTTPFVYVVPIPNEHKETFCTYIGCNSGVGIEIKQLPKELPRARKIDVCVAGQCTPDLVYEPGKREGKYVPKAYTAANAAAEGLHGPGPYPVSVTVYDRHNTVLLHASDSVIMKKSQPNGVHCPPTCFDASLTLNVGKHTLETAPT